MLRRNFLSLVSLTIFHRIFDKFVESQPIPDTDDPTDLEQKKVTKLSDKIRKEFWKKIGNLNPKSHNGFGNHDNWPRGKGEYLTVNRLNTIIIASNGLSDPEYLFPSLNLEKPKVNGFSTEFFIETSNILPSKNTSSIEFQDIENSWALALLSAVCSTVAYNGGIQQELEQRTVLSMELPGAKDHFTGKQFPKEYVTEDGHVGVLIGRPKADFNTLLDNMPLSKVTMVPIILITAKDLLKLRNNSTKERIAIAEKLVQSGRNHLSNF